VKEAERTSEALELVTELYTIVDRLERLFPGRKFTPDGHLVGSLGEVVAASRYAIGLVPMSTKGVDAVTTRGERVEIKATQGRSVAFRGEPPLLIVLRIARDGSAEEVFNGPGGLVWPELARKPIPSNGQRSISLARLRALQALVKPEQKVSLRTSVEEPSR